ncbi:MAG: DUF5675 family protein [Candidatus Acidiferrum sp.]
MNLILQRMQLDAISTTGEMTWDDVTLRTLELPVKDGLPGSAIPPGKYLVQMLPSPKFESSTDPWVLKYAGSIPHVLGIPNRSNILIHWGNDEADTEGCILVGQTEAQDWIGSSRPAFEVLWAALMGAKGRGEAISLTVQGGIPTVIPPNNASDVQEAIDPG